jgi:hypothetical protein
VMGWNDEPSLTCHSTLCHDELCLFDIHLNANSRAV